MPKLKGQEIVKNRADIIKDLNRAVAAELLAAYRYLYLSKYASGMHGQEVAERFAKMANDEWGHVGMFMERIIQLGGRPFERVSEAEKVAFGKYLLPPKDETDWKKMLKDSLEGERDAIDFYHKLLQKVHTDDAVTTHLVREALEDEVGDEHALATLLA
ncbi:MAG: ferritin-like domain-containing protein [Candidatus Acidoferrales bacterium]